MIDTGCTNHMYFDQAGFTNYQPYRSRIIRANGSVVWTKGKGTIEMEWALPDGTSNEEGMWLRWKDGQGQKDVFCEEKRTGRRYKERVCG